MIKNRFRTAIAVTALTVLILSLFTTLRITNERQAETTTARQTNGQATPIDTVTLDLSNAPEGTADFLDDPPLHSREYSTHSDVYFYKNSITPLLERQIALSTTANCYYGLYEVDGSELALFLANASNEREIEKLAHLLICYRDYFPIVLIGSFSESSTTMLCKVVGLQRTYNQEKPIFTSHLQVQNSDGGVFSLTPQDTDYTLDLTMPMIALTYDDGPSDYTDLIVSTYQKQHAKATFYVLGAQVELFENTVKQIQAAHCEIGNHSNLHEVFSSNTPAIIQKTIEETNRKIRAILGIGAATVRPPTGALVDRNQNSLAIGYPIVLWEGDTKDYEASVTSDSLYESVTAMLTDGTIILMHDTHEATAGATERILKAVAEQGYQTVTVSELIEFRLGGATADAVYRGVERK